jgi:predicted DNA-binding protein YlxM (UPF0122 family)
MDELFEISLLLDFYGQLITRRQYEVLDLHYNGDYSLGEIAQYLNISRQGVYDNIKRGKAALADMEQKLGLVGKFMRQKERAGTILKMLEGIDLSTLAEKDAEGVRAARQELRGIMED